MKQLLGMAREKKEKGETKPMGMAAKNTNLNKFAQPSYPPPS